MDVPSGLSNHLLIAMPGMADPNFSSTVTLICEHNDEGALGIVINRPLNLKLGGLLEQLSLEARETRVSEAPVLNGGPVAPDRGFVLYDAGPGFESSVAVSTGISLTLSRDILDAIADGRGPKRAIVALGYAGWEAGQLETEILANSWLNVPASPEIVFDVPFAERWLYATRALGIDIRKLSPDAGHA